VRLVEGSLVPVVLVWSVHLKGRMKEEEGVMPLKWVV